jgi:hypothetical protein
LERVLGHAVAEILGTKEKKTWKPQKNWKPILYHEFLQCFIEPNLHHPGA